MSWHDSDTRVTVPVSDESISVCETEREVRNMEANKCVAGAAVVAVTLAPPTSCLLLIIFVNDLIKMLKEGAGVDGFIF